MVQLFVRLSSDPKEWSLIELQGQVETRDSMPLNGMHIGDLYFNSEGVASLIIGHHLLTGRVVELEKPFAVLQRKRTSPETALDDEEGTIMDVDFVSDHDPHQLAKTEYEVIAFIKRKLTFTDRPNPIVQKASSKKL